MKKEKIKPLPLIKEFADYIVCRGKKVLGLKKSDFDHVSIDVHPDSKTIWIWFHAPEEIIGRAQFNFDGRCYHKLDNRLGEPTPIIKEAK